MNETLNRQLETLERDLVEAQPMQLFSAPSWTESVPDVPGVYAVWSVTAKQPIYVGETSDLRARMRDLGRYANHTCRRKLSERLGVGPEDERVLSEAIAKEHAASLLPVEFGRRELEEYLRVRWKGPLLNSAGPRQQRRFGWVQPKLPSPIWMSGWRSR